MRQRRARTPSSTSNDGQSSSVLPDLLPTTFRLAETSSLFSSIKDKQNDDELLRRNNNEDVKNTHEFSVVEIREKSLSSKQMVDIRDSVKTVQGQIVDTINIVETVDHFEPEFVETVNIIDASEDTSDDDEKNHDEMDSDEFEYELEKELEKFTNLDSDEVQMRLDDEQLIRIEKQRTSFDGEHKSFEKEHDILGDEEKVLAPIVSKKQPLKIRPTLRDILMADEKGIRDSFYNSDKENFDEPLIFSDDEDIPRYSLEMATDFDSDSDTVFFFVCLFLNCV